MARRLRGIALALGVMGFVCLQVLPAEAAERRARERTARVSRQSEGRVENPLFGYTHLLPSPFTVGAGRLLLGTDIVFGLTDFLQVGTGVLRDFYQFYNANAKVSLIDYPEFAFALTLGYEMYNLNDIDKANPDLKVRSWLPGAVAGFEVAPRLAWFVGANLNYTETNLKSNGIETSGYVHGAGMESDLSWAYNPEGKGVGNVLSGGVTYDITYKVIGFGLSHHWPGFHFGIHYYPNASQYRVLPIITGGAVVDL